MYILNKLEDLRKMDKIHKILIEEFKLKPSQVQNTIKLIDDGCTIPLLQDIGRK